jgi:manganese/zinc/iron transport system permease protein
MIGELLATLAFKGGYNTSIVMLGAALLGGAAGLVGVFAMLRRRALVSDAAAHAMLPGVALGFLANLALGLPGRFLPLILGGALLAATLAVVGVRLIETRSRLRSDAAIASVLSASFGLGLVLMSVVQSLPVGGQAGLDAFILGSTAGLRLPDVLFLGGAALVVTGVTLLLFKEFRLAAFDPIYAEAIGFRPDRVDLVLFALILVVVALGLRTVGAVLAVAVLVIPPVAARFWSDRLGKVLAIAALIGAGGAWVGAALSAVLPGLPTGSTIVLVLGALFLVSAGARLLRRALSPARAG